MERLIDRQVEVFYWLNGQSENYVGIVERVNNNLVFLTDVRANRSGWIRAEDQVVNTLSVSFVRFEIISR